MPPLRVDAPQPSVCASSTVTADPATRQLARGVDAGVAATDDDDVRAVRQRPARSVGQRGHGRLPERAALVVVVQRAACHGHRRGAYRSRDRGRARADRASGVRRLVGDAAAGHRQEHAARQVDPEQRRVLAARQRAPRASTVQRSERSKTTRSAGRAFDEPDRCRATAPRTEDPRRPDGQRLDGARAAAACPASTSSSSSPSAVSMPLIPFAAQPELDRLVDLGVRRVVRGDRVGRAVEQRDRGRPRASTGAAQRRVHAQSRSSTGAASSAPSRPRVARRAVLVERIPRPAPRAGDPLVGQREVVRRHVAGDRQAARLRVADRARATPAVETCVRWSRAPGTSRDDLVEDRESPARPRPPRPRPASRAARGPSRRGPRSPRRRRSASGPRDGR